MLDGYKNSACRSWTNSTAGSEAGRGEQVFFQGGTAGLSFELKEKGFLPEMSEGIACFNDEAIVREIGSSERVRLFGKCEILYIYLSFCGWSSDAAMMRLSRMILGISEKDWNCSAR